MRTNLHNFNKIGFINNSEFLPDFFDQFDSKTKVRQLFLNLINSILHKNCMFNKYEQKTFSKYDLNNIFKLKARNLDPTSFIFSNTKKKEYFKFCKNSTIIINNYKNKSLCKTVMSNSNLVPLANFLNTTFTGNNFELLIDKDYLFNEFIIKKIKRIHPDKMIIDEGNSLSIIKDKKTLLKIYNAWRNIDKNNLDIKQELNKAIKDINNKCEFDVYIIYPKNENFEKHIQIELNTYEDMEYKIKAIPYSFRSILRQTI